MHILFRAQIVMCAVTEGVLCMQVSPAGHCPHHEAPAAVHEAMIGWLQATETSSALPWAVGERRQYENVTVTHVDGTPRNIFEKADVLWNALRNRFWGG